MSKKLLVLALASICVTHLALSNESEWRPDFYKPLEKNQTSQMRHAIKEIPKLHLTGNETVLDVGCGDGAITKHIAHHLLPYGTIHGIDISQPMMDKAVQKYTDANISFECASLFDYKPTPLYDAVVCFWVLYLFDDYATALNNVVACLKPGGKALICHIIHPGTPFLQLFKKNIAPQQMSITLPTLDTIMAAVKGAPVSIEYLEVKYNYERYPNLDELYAIMKKIPFFNLLPKEKEASFYQELISTYKPKSDASVYDYSHAMCMILEKK